MGAIESLLFQDQSKRRLYTTTSTRNNWLFYGASLRSFT